MILWFLACKPEVVDISMAELQVVGTHNSYHITLGEGDFGPYDYDHPPLHEQMDLGVRQYELDLYWMQDTWFVVHEPVFDPGTSCETLSDCLSALRTGSERNAEHLPVMILLEIKQGHDDQAETRLQALSTLLDQDLQHILAPAEIQGAAPSMRDAMLSGWPVLDGQRGTFLPVIHENGSWASDGRTLGLDNVYYDAYGDLDADWAAIHSSNDAYSDEIGRVADAGHLVRTRSDSNTTEARENDTARRDQAFASGAHFISTDFPQAHPITGYRVHIEGVARCNPRTASEACQDAVLE